MKCSRERTLPIFLVWGGALFWAFSPVVAMAKVQVLSETVLKVDGKEIKGHKRVIGHPAVKELLASFGKAEAALKKEDLDALMAFYGSTYNYHGLKEPDVRRVWGEVFTHYEAVESLHLFSDITVTQTGSQLRAKVTCTGGLYGTEEGTGKRMTLDSWFREVHYLVKEEGGWRFLGNAGDAPSSAPFSSAPHHPMF
ncbi:MAG: hypothetical protein HP495_15120 [Nitrospira sp.]|nr:hypothetical protein [Nitrospira sp.]